MMDQFNFSNKHSDHCAPIVTHKYVRTFSPPPKKTQQDIFHKYLKHPK